MSEKSSLKPTERFSDRVENYIKYRPTYPAALIDFMKSEFGLGRESTVVDVGSGTGILSELLLQAGASVTGVEPNPAMRGAAEKLLSAKFPRFRSLDGRSERTGLPDACADLITAAQAYHWFEPASTRVEFQRILKPGGFVVLIWNDRITTGSPFAIEYERLIMDFSTEYKTVNHQNLEEADLRRFLGENGYGKRSFPNSQELDFDGFVGRLTSSSYAPNVGHPRHPEMVRALRDLFDRYQAGGRIRIDYDCKAFFGNLTPKA